MHLNLLIVDDVHQISLNQFHRGGESPRRIENARSCQLSPQRRCTYSSRGLTEAVKTISISLETL